MSDPKPVTRALAILILAIVALLSAAISWVLLFGETVKTKFTEANQAVTNEVTFGEASSAPAAPAAQAQPVKPSLPAPTRPQVADTDSFNGGEVINTMRVTRQYRKKSSSGPTGPYLMRGSRAESAAPEPPAPPAPKLRPPPPLKPDDLAPPTPSSTKIAPGQVNPMTKVVDDALSTFSIDVDTGSYTLARRMINEDYEVLPHRVRVEEFLNYFPYAYPEPQQGAFGVSLDAAPSPFDAASNRKIMRVGVQGKRLTDESRKSAHLTFLVDVSGSMAGPERMGLLKESLRILTRNLGPGDTVAITTYAGTVETILEPSSMLRRNQIYEAIDSLKTYGKTGMGNGLEMAYKLALDSYVEGAVNRIIVLSDGDSNLGPSSYSAIFKRIRAYVEEGITLTTIGFGMGNYQDEMMEQLANQGNGNYFYIDSQREARRIFGEQLDATLQVIAKDVKIQVEFDPAAVVSYRLLGYENRDIADKDFRNDRVDAGEIGAGHSVTALYEVVLTEAAARAKADSKLATVRIRAKTPTGTEATEQAFVLNTRDMHADLSDAGPDFQFAAAVAGFAEILRDSPYAKELDLALIEELAKSASRLDQVERQEFIGLVSKVKSVRAVSAGVARD
ncbi:vWA domain-containing protein [Bradymonas sediminis]|uniref:VWA domain-containing protein n=1 Tax=Bradymonas sediminis TaxID=1548548 RepID=A0A2Z4FPV0_9DELT|nr:von Willebrand factor type A domain-containing protein [Bradymonas sediminis]AWV90785.1 VWA domain-containing protein [Bradymonas sediminis]TDP75481.1 Ca-activated chloride channel family protein [Bradymonas sediminis]